MQKKESERMEGKADGQEGNRVLKHGKTQR